jgi:hypothetical protein
MRPKGAFGEILFACPLVKNQLEQLRRKSLIK